MQPRYKYRCLALQPVQPLWAVSCLCDFICTIIRHTLCYSSGSVPAAHLREIYGNVDLQMPHTCASWHKCECAAGASNVPQDILDLRRMRVSRSGCVSQVLLSPCRGADMESKSTRCRRVSVETEHLYRIALVAASGEAVTTAQHSGVHRSLT